jgi:hypothetical protein
LNNAADFAYSHAIGALGLDAPGWFEEVITVAIEQGVLAATLRQEPSDLASPADAWLLAWPTVEGGLMSCITAGRDGAANQFAVAWPFATAGIVQQIDITAVHADEDCGFVRLCQGTVDGVSLTAFDTFCAGASRPIAAGDRVSARLHAWAVSAERGSTEPHRFRPEDVSDSVREAFRETFERDGILVIHTDRLVALFPRRSVPSPLYEYRSPVKAVRESAPLLGMSVWILTLTVGRSEDDDSDLDIELSVTSGIWKGPPPQPGDAVQGILWLQASFE